VIVVACMDGLISRTMFELILHAHVCLLFVVLILSQHISLAIVDEKCLFHVISTNFPCLVGKFQWLTLILSSHPCLRSVKDG
jgi:hypothetical protein